jgi:hypothetical protein
MNKHLTFLMKKKDWMRPCIERSQVHSLIIHYDKFGDLVREVLEEIVEEIYLTSWEVLGYYFVQRCLLPNLFSFLGCGKNGDNLTRDLTWVATIP